jgi:hypothetical protein
LHDVIEHYEQLGALGLGEDEKSDLVEFGSRRREAPTRARATSRLAMVMRYPTRVGADVATRAPACSHAKGAVLAHNIIS